MFECFKSKNGGNVYYYNGKRISKREAQDMSLKLGKKLPSCITKTSKNEINSLKKRIKDIMISGETVNKDLQERLNACSIIREKYDNLISLIDSTSDSVDVMNRVCLTQGLKRKLDDEYSILENNLKESSLKNEELGGIVENDKLTIKELTNMLFQIKQINLNLESTIEQEKKDKINIEKTLNILTEECSDRPDLLKTIDTLRGQIYNLELNNNDIKKDLQDTRNINKNMKASIDDLLESLQTYKDQAKVMESMTKTIDYYTVAVQRYESEISILERENKELRDTITRNGDLQGLLDQLRDELSQKTQEFDIELQNEKEQCKIANDSLERKVQAMADLSKSLKYSLQQEKDKCLNDIQKAIDGEREISKKEAREYENKIAELNSKILITEESLEELNKIGKIQTTGEIEGTKKSLKKVSKKLKRASQ